MARYYEDARRLAYMLTEWSIQIPARRPPFRGHHRRWPRNHGSRQPRRPRRPEAKSIGLNINLPFEQNPNSYITPALNFEFHYFLHA